MNHKLEELLLQVEKPAQYIGSEINAEYKEKGDYSYNMALAFPDTYEIGMSHLGIQILYKLINKKTDFFCQRAFAPAIDMENLLVSEHIPLFTLEDTTPLNELDLLGFTLQYELSYTNILNMLKLGGIPIYSKDRKEEDPIILAGGPCGVNPEPIADFIDLFVIGEGEEITLTLLELYKTHKEKGWNRKGFLEDAKNLQGIYVPGLYEMDYSIRENKPFATIKDIEDVKIEKAYIKDLEQVYYPEDPIVPYINTVHNRAVIEIFRGCTRGCRFCQAGMIYRPVREKSLQQIKSIAKNSLENTGFDEMSLVSLSTSDYSQIEPLVVDLMADCSQNNVSISLPSMRLDSFSFKAMEEIQKYKKSGLTFAPEAGSQRLRNVINKSITEDDIMNACTQAFELGWHSIKLYFMIGLPTETQEDLDEMVALGVKISNIYRGIHEGKMGKLNITISVSDFVPKPHTPFQWEPQNAIETFKEKHDYLRDNIKKYKHIRFKYHDAEASFLEGIFARGDRCLSKVLEIALEKGCKFDSWREHFDFELWLAAFEEAGINPEVYNTQTLSKEAVLPWDMIRMGVDKGYLKREYEKAMKEAVTEDCRLNCNGCGILDCTMKEQ